MPFQFRYDHRKFRPESATAKVSTPLGDTNSTRKTVGIPTVFPFLEIFCAKGIVPLIDVSSLTIQYWM